MLRRRISFTTPRRFGVTPSLADEILPLPPRGEAAYLLRSFGTDTNR